MSMKLSNTHVFVVNERICKTVKALERQAGACILQGKDINIICVEFGSGVVVGTTRRSNGYARMLDTTELVNICLGLCSDQCLDD